MITHYYYLHYYNHYPRIKNLFLDSTQFKKRKRKKEIAISVFPVDQKQTYEFSISITIVQFLIRIYTIKRKQRSNIFFCVL